MIYPADFEERIGFTPVRQMIAAKCVSPMGVHLSQKMEFMTDIRVVKRSLLCVKEMMEVIAEGYDLPLGSLHDLRQEIHSVSVVGTSLGSGDFARLRQLFAAMESLQKLMNSDRWPTLRKAFSRMGVFPELSAEIDRIIDKYGNVRDNASPELREIRSQLAAASSSMASAMRRVLARATAAGIVDKDTAPSMRDGRLVIPVEAGKKREIQGIVQDESATGRTVYIEPAEVVEASNRVRELERQEHREIMVILTKLTDLVRPFVPDILDSLVYVGWFDFMHAKALFAREVDAQMPHLQEAPLLEWYHAVHPVMLLSLRQQGREVVPLNLNLDAQRRILVISGPNAGGKSVALKTVGVVQYMMQCGVLPTLYDNSHMGIFRNIFVDIGDAQSMESDLSTYSSHLRNMKHFLLHADDRSLVLADEMGSGTEPQVGGAMAQAIIARLNRKSHCFGIITTHYQNLKTFAEGEEGVVNGAMLYDRQHLRPLFELSVGNAGSSFALEIARNIGLPQDVIDDTKEIVGSDYVDMEKYLLDIARDRRYWANKRLSIKEKEHKVDQILEQNEERARLLREQRDSIISDAKAEAAKVLSGANAVVERTVHEIRKAEAEKERTRQLRQELADYRKQVEEGSADEDTLPELLKEKKRRDNKKKKQPAQAPQSSSPNFIGVGDSVKMEGSAMAGTVLSISGKEAEVAFGALRTHVKLDKLVKTGKAKPKDNPVNIVVNASDDSRRRQLDFKQEIDLRGMRADEALQAVMYFLDDAHQFNIGRVRILHGTGTGALRQAIRSYLSSSPLVEEYHDEDVRFGGAGITVVEMR